MLRGKENNRPHSQKYAGDELHYFRIFRIYFQNKYFKEANEEHNYHREASRSQTQIKYNLHNTNMCNMIKIS